MDDRQQERSYASRSSRHHHKSPKTPQSTKAKKDNPHFFKSNSVEIVVSSPISGFMQSVGNGLEEKLPHWKANCNFMLSLQTQRHEIFSNT